MALGSFAIEQIFDSIWEKWPNKEGESSARKAVTIYFKSDGSKADLLKACEGYILENANSDPAFTYKLSNFINQEHWRDVLENVSIDKLNEKKKEAIEVIEKWNEVCKPHWCKVVDIDARIGVVMTALNNKPFATNWKQALKKASGIFRYPAREGDSKQKIILSLSWFSTTSPKHTVLRIIEGEFGKEQAEDRIVAPKLVSMNPNPPTQEERMAVAAEFHKMMTEGGIELKIKPVKPIKKNVITPEIREAAIRLAESICPGFEEQGEDDDEFKLI